MAPDRYLVAAALLLAAAAAVRSRAHPRMGRWLGLGAALVLLGQLVARWIVSGRPPVFGTFETSLAETLCLLALGLYADKRLGGGLLRGPSCIAVATLAHTFLLRHEITPLTISEVSWWIDLHAPLAWLAWALYLVAACLAFGGEKRRQLLAARLVGLGFLAHSAMAFVGVYYATLLFATPWSWDPVQILGLLSWTLAAVLLHLHLFYRVSLYRLRYFLALVAFSYVLSAKAMLYFPPGQSFHVFELGAMAGG